MDRNVQALSVARKYTMYTAAAGSIPILGVDLAAVAALQVKMLSELCEVYGVSFNAGRGRAVVVGLVGSFTAFSHGVPGWMVARHSWLTPIGVVLKPVYLSVVTYAIAHVFILHFERGGTLETFNPLSDDVKATVADAINQAKQTVTRGRAASPSA